ncbi:lipoprotein [Actinomadura sp. NBRC 104412]|uniref:ABC transporter substrate-binding protein n=1 Tax=Actinomadura sp. NBRC 104412 TaxID=3032203 RepID=UPI0024A32097|nr:ABC transporter substrate-binding protein [Actinomadura sp. NBRC 104412]GLZ05712.1 lipoprotein [Actinomadura sp. NBRC 104412]
MDSARCDSPRRVRPPRRRALRAALAGAALLAAVTGCGIGSDGGSAAPVPGVTEEPCPRAVNKEHGCIYLGIISDLTVGPFTDLGTPMVVAQKAFWDRVNRQGGIGGYDVDVHTYVRDNRYDPATHRRAFQEIKGRVLALAHSLGSPTTEAILGELRSARMIAVPASYPSKWEFEDVILESGASYCFEAMNAVDYAVDQFKAKSVLSVHYPGDYGGDAAAGARIGAEARGVSFSELEIPQGAGRQEKAIQTILTRKPDLVVVTAGPAETAAIVSKTVEAGFQGRFMGNNPTYTAAILRTPAAPAMKARYLVVSPWKPFAYDSPGHTAMRQALGRVLPDDAYTSGWVLSYPLKAMLERAAANGNLTRDGVYEALSQTTTVDYEGMLPRHAGNFSGTPNAAAFRESVIARPDDREFTGSKVITDFAPGPTAKAHRLESPCYNPG